MRYNITNPVSMMSPSHLVRIMWASYAHHVHHGCIVCATLYASCAHHACINSAPCAHQVPIKCASHLVCIMCPA